MGWAEARIYLVLLVLLALGGLYTWLSGRPMALQLGALRDALVGAGASSDKAPAASGEVAAHRRDTADIRSDLRVIKWMLWFVLALQVVVAGKLLLL